MIHSSPLRIFLVSHWVICRVRSLLTQDERASVMSQEISVVLLLYKQFSEPVKISLSGRNPYVSIKKSFNTCRKILNALVNDLKA